MAVLGAVDASAVEVATDAATDLKDTGVAVMVVLIPLAVGFILVKKALPWGRRLLGI